MATILSKIQASTRYPRRLLTRRENPRRRVQWAHPSIGNMGPNIQQLAPTRCQAFHRLNYPTARNHPCYAGPYPCVCDVQKSTRLPLLSNTFAARVNRSYYIRHACAALPSHRQMSMPKPVCPNMATATALGPPGAETAQKQHAGLLKMGAQPSAESVFPRARHGRYLPRSGELAFRDTYAASGTNREPGRIRRLRISLPARQWRLRDACGLSRLNDL